MKYVLVLCDGMADYPVDSLGGKRHSKPLIPQIWILLRRPLKSDL